MRMVLTRGWTGANCQLRGRSVTPKTTRTVTDVLMQNCHQCPETSQRELMLLSLL